MTSYTLILAALLVAALIASIPTTLHADETQSPGPTLTDRVEATLPDHVGAAVLVIDHGKTVFRQAFGLADVENQTPVTPQTNFRIASITKQFTATAVMLLVDDGKLSLDDTLDQFFPGFPNYSRRITVRHLLNHRSGLPDYEDLIPENTTLQVHDIDVLQLILDTDRPLFEPGTDYKYSNTGYTLLGLIVEQVAAQPFHQFLKARIFNPLGMDRSVMFVRGLNTVTDRAFGHTQQDGRWTRDDQSLTSAVRGDGGIYSSINDLAKWIAAVDNQQLLSDESTQQMFTPVPTDDETIGYGFGWRIDTYKGQRRIHHTGGTRGFSLCLQRYPDRNAAVIVLINNHIEGNMTPVANRVADMVLFAGE
jgi:CubicO group peptidase (beta-lactamase class C family)